MFVTAKQAQAIYAALGIEKREIERRQPWQNYIETNFNVQRRMADWDFAKATTWAELLAIHDQWVVNYNYQSHWAHQERDDDRRSPRDVLGWVCGGRSRRRSCTGSSTAPASAGSSTSWAGALPALAHIRRARFGEEHAAVWLYGETLTIEFADEPLARYRVRYQPDKKHLRAIEEPQAVRDPVPLATTGVMGVG